MESETQVEGRNAVLELLDSGRDINKIFVVARRKTWLYHENTCKSKSTRNSCTRSSKEEIGRDV